MRRLLALMGQVEKHADRDRGLEIRCERRCLGQGGRLMLSIVPTSEVRLMLGSAASLWQCAAAAMAKAKGDMERARTSHRRADIAAQVAGLTWTEAGLGARCSLTRSPRDGRFGHRTSLPSRPPPSMHRCA